MVIYKIYYDKKDILETFLNELLRELKSIKF